MLQTFEAEDLVAVAAKSHIEAQSDPEDPRQFPVLPGLGCAGWGADGLLGHITHAAKAQHFG